MPAAFVDINIDKSWFCILLVRFHGRTGHAAPHDPLARAGGSSVARGAARRQHWWAAFQHYVKVLKWPVIIGVGSAFVYVIGWTAINKAGNGPLALIFLGPVGLAAGIVLGTVIWPFVSMKPNNTFERDARKSGARPSP